MKRFLDRLGRVSWRIQPNYITDRPSHIKHKQGEKKWHDYYASIQPQPKQKREETWHANKRLNPYGAAIALLGIYPREMETYIYTETCAVFLKIATN